MSTLTSPPSLAVNSISWAPYELGPILACASSDGKISVLKFNGMTAVAELHHTHTHIVKLANVSEQMTAPQRSTHSLDMPLVSMLSLGPQHCFQEA